MGSKNVIYGINGPVVTVRKTKDFSMQEMVFVINARMAGGIIMIKSQITDHQAS